MFWRHAHVYCISHYLVLFMWTTQCMTALTTYYLPISPGADRYLSYCIYLCFCLSLSDCHSCFLTTQTQNLSLTRADVFAQLGLSQSDVPLWQHTVRYIRGKNLSRSLIFVKEERAGCDVAIYPGWKWRGWQVAIKAVDTEAKACRVRRERERRNTRSGSSREEVSTAKSLYCLWWQKKTKSRQATCQQAPQLFISLITTCGKCSFTL